MAKEPKYIIELSIESFLEIKTALFRKMRDHQRFLELCIERKDEDGVALFERAIAQLEKAEQEMEKSRKLTYDA
jgi:hypothetical protein